MTSFVRKQQEMGYAKYPNEDEVMAARDVLKPPGIMSNNYNKPGLKKVERPFISAKDATTKNDGTLMYQTNYMPEFPISAEENSYFNVKTQRSARSLYDRINHTQCGYNEKLHRDDREHAKSRGLKLNQEERQRPVPATSSAIYGHRKLKLEKVSNQHNHVEICRQDFNRINGVNI